MAQDDIGGAWRLRMSGGYFILSTDMPQCGAPGRWTNRHSGAVPPVSRSLALSAGYVVSSHVMQLLFVERRPDPSRRAFGAPLRMTTRKGVVLRRRSRRRIWAGGTSNSHSRFTADIEHCPHLLLKIHLENATAESAELRGGERPKGVATVCLVVRVAPRRVKHRYLACLAWKNLQLWACLGVQASLAPGSLSIVVGFPGSARPSTWPRADVAFAVDD